MSDFVPLKAYEDGLQGWIDSPRDRVLWQESQARPIYSEPNLVGTGLGKKALLYAYYLRCDRNAFKEVQTVSDCVSHGSRNARDCTRATQILIGGDPKAFVSVSATEPTYGARGHGRDGMVPAVASRFERDNGFVLRKKIGSVDLTKYNGALGDKWGTAGIPGEVMEECKQSKVGIIRQITTVRDAMDCLANGYAIHSGQYAAWEAKPNKQNYHNRARGGWAHDMATVGYDDTKTFWPDTVFFVANSWGAWNQLPAWPDDYPPPPPGLIVATASDWSVCVENGDAWAYGNVDGFPPQRLPDYGAIGLLKVDDA